MIVKSYEVEKKVSNLLTHNLFLFYGENFGLKKDLKEFIKKKLKEKDKSVEILSVYEKEVLDNDENFFNSVYSGSLFSAKKIITIYDGTDKIIEKINKVYDKYPENVFLIIFSEVLEKKSKLRNFFESHEKTICVPCYLDSEKDLEIIAHTEFKKNNISISREAVNLLIEKSNSDRNNLRNEIEKIEYYTKNGKKLSTGALQKLTNLIENHSISELIDNCLAKNKKKTLHILNENNYNNEDSILIVRSFLNKSKKILKLLNENKKNNNIDLTISNAKPPIFWKDKEITKKQLLEWELKNLKQLIYDLNNVEFHIKKNINNSINIITNFILEKTTHNSNN